MLTLAQRCRLVELAGCAWSQLTQSGVAWRTGVLAAALLVLLPSCSCSDETRRPGGGAPDAGGSADQVGLVVGSPEARACDILLEEQGDARARGADFADLVRGSFQARSPLVAVSFFNRADQGFSAPPVALEVDAAGEDPPVVVRQATCYDRQGRPLDDASVELDLPEAR